MTSERDTSWVLNPSDFAFLWEECKRCLYLKVHENFRRPSAPMAKIFTVIDAEMKNCYAGKRTEKMMLFLPPGVVDTSVSWVQSNPIKIAGRRSRCVIRGKIDSLVRFDDNSFAVIDFKTSSPRAEHIHLYGRQLHAYAHALEQAAPGHASLSPVKKMGLLVYEPREFARDAAEGASLTGSLTWIPVKRDDEQFRGFLGQILGVLENPAPPPAEDCAWCRYREASRKNQF